jgi:hypothetical protein
MRRSIISILNSPYAKILAFGLSQNPGVDVSNLTYFALTLGFILVILLALFAFKLLAKGWSFKLLFKDFKRKIWMTVSLGGLFFFFYLLFVGVSVYVVRDGKLDLFFLGSRNLVQFIYGGLWLFVFLSLSIYLARMVIKYFYLTRGKDS